MKTLFSAFGNIVAATLLFGVMLCFASFFTGSIVWLLWDPTVTNVFPSLVERGVVAGHISWWTAVKLVWLIAGLFAARTAVNKASEKNQ